MSDIRQIDVNKMDDLIGKINLIDIREPYEYAEKTLETAVNIPMGKILEVPEEYLSLDKEYYILCRSGMRSLNTCMQLLEEGYNVIDVAGGMINYTGNRAVKGK